MFQQARIAVIMLLLMTLLTGGIYPAVVTLIAQAAFPKQANGSLIQHDGKVVGSELIGQSFSREDYFWGRLSATANVPYNGAASGGSNLGPLNPTLKSNAEQRLQALGVDSSDSSSQQKVPVDLVTSSASGLDPHISPAAALYQVARVAKARKMSEADIETLVRDQIQSRQLGVLGEPRVNVLQLNLKLEKLSARE